VARVLARIHALRGDLRETRKWSSLQRLADNFLDTTVPGDWNQSMMELGATVCTPQTPQCSLCPVARHCRARQLGVMDQIPEKRIKHDVLKVVLASAIFVDPTGLTLLMPPPPKVAGLNSLAKRKSKPKKSKIANDVSVLLSNIWHFPSVAVRKNAGAELQSSFGDLFPSLNWRRANVEALPPIRHCVTYRAITLMPYRITVGKLPSLPGARKVRLSKISSLAISNLTRKAANAALAHADSVDSIAVPSSGHPCVILSQG
jgi:A/G-specific adenine glycosylase